MYWPPAASLPDHFAQFPWMFVTSDAYNTTSPADAETRSPPRATNNTATASAAHIVHRPDFE
jgi:hypothetical protein